MGKGGWFGPMLRCDLVRLTRRGWATIFLARALYIGSLFLALILFYAVETRLRTPKEVWDAFLAGAPISQRDAPNLAGRFFAVMLGVQFAAVLLLTPAYMAGAIAEDRERRTLDFLLASALTNREIVLGKFFARLAHLGLLLLAGLPVLGLVQQLGGVDPNLVLAGFLALALMMGSLGSVAVLQSIYARRPREAVFRTYAIAGAYLLFSSTCCLSLSAFRPTGIAALDDHIGGIFSSGNPLAALMRLESRVSAGRSQGRLLAEILIDYAIFHVPIIVLCLGWSIRHLRRHLMRTPEAPFVEMARAALAGRASTAEEAALQSSLPVPRELPTRHRRVSDRPLLWKEMHVEAKPYQFPGAWGFFTESAFFMGVLTVGSTFLFGLLAGAMHGMQLLHLFINLWARVVGTIVACLSVLCVAVRAAGCLSRERERQTLDALLTTTLSDRTIVNAKWLGSILSLRAGWVRLAVVWILATLTGGIDWRILPLLLVSCASFAALAAGVGVCCSLLCHGTGRATAVTLAVLIVIGVPWMPGRGTVTPVEGLILLMTPLRTAHPDLRWLDTSSDLPRALLSLFCCASLAALLWVVAHVLFAPVTGRQGGNTLSAGWLAMLRRSVRYQNASAKRR